MERLTKEDARRFLLIKHGLCGAYKFSGKEGVLQLVRQLSCVQFDPIDVCGKSPELVFQSRIKGFQKQWLYQLLYEDRALVDDFDKNLAIYLVEDRPYFERQRERARQEPRSSDVVNALAAKVKAAIGERGTISSADLGWSEKSDWAWSKNTRVSRVVLEALYFRGELVIHHKKGTNKYYDLAENCLPSALLLAKEPFPLESDYLKWRVLRRIGAVGLLWNKASDAWLNIAGLKSAQREAAFSALLAENAIFAVAVEGIKEPLYCLTGDMPLLHTLNSDQSPRCEVIAPLDNLLWDRKLIQALWGFSYKWEIYTPEAERKYGYYVLPLLYGHNFVGRVEARRQNDTLLVKNLWLEPGVRDTKKLRAAFDGCMRRLADFNGCTKVVGPLPQRDELILFGD